MDPTPLHPKVMTKLPDMAVYGPGVAGNVKRKSTVTVQPLSGTTFTPKGQRIIQIQLPKNGFLNGLNSYLAFKHSSVNTETGANTMASAEKNALSTSASNWIQRLRIKIGGKIVEDIDDYNVLHEILRSSVVTSQFRDSISGQLEGYEPSQVAKMIEPQGSGAAADGATRPAFTLCGTAGTAPYCEYLDGVIVNSNRSGGLTRGNDAELLYPSDSHHTLQYWAQVGKEYQVILLSGLLRSAKYLPLRFMPPLEIEITLADFERSHVWAPARDTTSAASYYANCDGTIDPGLVNATPSSKTSIQSVNQLAFQPAVDSDFVGTTLGRHPRATAGVATETTTADKTYKIENVSFIAEILEFDDSFYQAFEASLSQGITIPYVTYTNHVYGLQTTTGDIQIAERVRSARSLLAVFRNSKDLAHPPYPKFLFTRQGVTQFQVKIGTQYFPMQPIDTSPTTDMYSGERLIELQKVISAMSDVSHGMATNFMDYEQKFIIGMDLQREFDRLSGLDTTKGLPLFLSLKGANVSCQLNVFVSYDMFVDLFPGEVVEVLN